MAIKKAAPKEKPARRDGQITGLAGELFVAAELLKRGLQTSVTFGNAKAIDLFAHNPRTERTFTVQVKAVRRRTDFLIAHARINKGHVYVFVILNEPNEAVEYFIVPGTVLAGEPNRFGKWFVAPNMPGIKPSALKDFENQWGVFDE